MFGVEARSIPELYPFGIFAIPEIAWVGSHGIQLTKQAIAYETGVARYKEIARGQILDDLSGMLKLGARHAGDRARAHRPGRDELLAKHVERLRSA
jgi:pyruvate/2-oxoglutarate dehydrogenase complex dihydrolipoamide dehydrogenase (E3) component